MIAKFEFYNIFFFCYLGSSSFPGASLDQPGYADVVYKRLHPTVYTFLYEKRGDAGSGTTFPV